MVDHRRERRRLAGSGGAGEQHDPALLLGQFGHHRGQCQFLDRRDLVRDRAAGDRDQSALAERVDAKASDFVDFKREVDLVLGGEFLELGLVAEQLVQRGLGLLRAQRRRALVARELAIDAIEGGRARLQVQIGAVLIHQLAQSLLDVEHTRQIGSGVRGL